MMIRNRLLALTTIIAWSLPGVALGHEGHEKKVMGTVTMAAVDHVMVKTPDGKEQRSMTRPRCSRIKRRCRGPISRRAPGS